MPMVQPGRCLADSPPRRALYQHIKLMPCSGMQNSRDNGGRERASPEIVQRARFISRQPDGSLVPSDFGVAENMATLPHQLQNRFLGTIGSSGRDGALQIATAQDVSKMFLQ